MAMCIIETLEAAMEYVQVTECLLVGLYRPDTKIVSGSKARDGRRTNLGRAAEGKGEGRVRVGGCMGGWAYWRQHPLSHKPLPTSITSSVMHVRHTQ